MVESDIRPLWSLQHSATHQPTTHCIYNIINEETGEMQNYQKLLKQNSTREILSLAMCKSWVHYPNDTKASLKEQILSFL